jgi:hypothetical protein
MRVVVPSNRERERERERERVRENGTGIAGGTKRG